MPNELQARKTVDAMLAMRTSSGNTLGKKGQTFADFQLLRYPVYLPILNELAKRGDARGLDAIGAMAFPEATAAILELMQHPDAAIATKAGDLLFARSPCVHDGPATCRDYLADRSWTDELKESAMKPAWKLLAEHDREGIIRGGRIVQALGTKNDLPDLIKVMDRVLVEFKDNEIEQCQYLRPATASEALANAARELLRRGTQPPATAASPGSAVAWLLGLGLNERFRPDGWPETLRGLMRHEIPFVREVALLNRPLPLDDATVATLAEMIKDEFAPVQGAACNLAAKVKSKSLNTPLVEVLETTKNDWVLCPPFGPPRTAAWKTIDDWKPASHALNHATTTGIWC